MKKFSIYVSFCSRPMNGKSLDFYLRPKREILLSSTTWFDDAPVGIHRLQSTVGRICKDAGMVGYYTNHSLRATAATRMYDEGMDEQLISEKTGHSSTAVRSYKRTSDQQQKEVSNVVQCSKRFKASTSSTGKQNMEFNFEGNGMSFHFKI